MQGDEALVGGMHAGESLEQASFATAGGTYDERDLSGWGGEGNVIENGAGIACFGVEGTGEIVGIQHGAELKRCYGRAQGRFMVSASEVGLLVLVPWLG